MKAIAIGAVAAAVALGAAFELGRAAGPGRALAQQAQDAADAGPHSKRHALPQPYDVRVHMRPDSWTAPMTGDHDFTASGVQTWENETVGGYTFLRLQVASGKLWYIPFEHLSFVEATPVLSPTSPEVQQPQAPAPPK